MALSDLSQMGLAVWVAVGVLVLITFIMFVLFFTSSSTPSAQRQRTRRPMNVSRPGVRTYSSLLTKEEQNARLAHSKMVDTSQRLRDLAEKEAQYNRDAAYARQRNLREGSEVYASIPPPPPARSRQPEIVYSQLPERTSSPYADLSSLRRFDTIDTDARARMLAERRRRAQ